MWGIKVLTKVGICRPSNSNWAIFRIRKADGRPCGDCWALNANTIPVRYLVPFLQDFSTILTVKEIFFKIDLQKAFHQMPILPDDICKTVITTPFFFELTHLPFGVRNSPQMFQRLINEVLPSLDFTFVYLDDICITSNSVTEYKKHFRTVFNLLEVRSLNCEKRHSSTTKTRIVDQH